MKAFVFPGQGAQFKGMGAALLDDFKTLVRHADEVLGYSLRELCVDDPRGQLSQTQYTQVAIFAVSALHYLKHFEDTNEDPEFFAGHSLGEYSALFAAQSFDFATGLKLVKKRGELMAQARNGGMAAVIGDNLQVAVDMVNEQAPELDIANYNSDIQLVLSGPPASLERISPLLTARQFTVVPLPVSAAFHSRHMTQARDEFKTFLDGVEIKAPAKPVIANVSALPYPSEQAQMKELLVDQITGSVRWTNSVRYLRAQGCANFSEFGPGQTLTRLIAKIA